MHRACLIAASCVAAWVILALPLGVTAAAPAGQDTVTQPEAAAAVASPTVAPAITPAPGAGIQDTQAMLAVVRMFGRMPGTLQAPIAVPAPQPNTASRVAWTASAGNSAELKKAQNQATKNITSEAMNRIIP